MKKVSMRKCTLHYEAKEKVCCVNVKQTKSARVAREKKTATKQIKKESKEKVHADQAKLYHTNICANGEISFSIFRLFFGYEWALVLISLWSFYKSIDRDENDSLHLFTPRLN